ncbi:hypothetical protein GA0070623_1953 [Micromonospora rifamycinica]|uniref:PEGA domain-containing protein n=1 Tax=Micromonospora rifamycinica TaxID=291594 RepID=A0A1C5I0B0_9ACTN|nr:hypothetical protein GA0070623_1953 [Micromonospora rifamycinica]
MNRMPTVIFVRGIDTIGAGRKFRIYVDGQLAAKLGNSDRISIEIGAGSHVVQARLDWLRSPPLTLELTTGDVVTVETTARGRATSFTGTFLRPRSAIDMVVKGYE